MSCDCNTLIVGEAGPQGPQGLAGTNGTNGTNGINAFTTVSGSSYVQPAVNGSVSFNVANNAWIAVGQAIFVSDGGYYEVSSVSGSSSVTAYLRSVGSVAPGGSVAVGKKVSPAAVATYAAPLSSLTVNGTSILDGAVLINQSNANRDVVVEGLTDTGLFVCDASTNRVGVGISSPSAKLHVSGTFQVGTGPYGSDSEFTKGAVFNSLQGSVSFAATDVVIKTQNVVDTFVVVGYGSNADRVGVGTATPSRLFDVDGTGQTKAWIVNPGSAASVDGDTTVFRVLGSGSVSCIVVDATNNRVGIRNSIPSAPLDVSGSTNLNGNLVVSTSALVVQTSGNYVGVNTSSPSTHLSVNGSGDFAGNLSISGTFLGASSCSVSSLAVSGATNLFTLVATSTVNVDSGVLYVDTSNNRVGVNTTAPSRSLSVVGAAGFSGDVFIGSNVYVDTDVFVVDIANNRVGVNISSPTSPLDISGVVHVRSSMSAAYASISSLSALTLSVSGSAIFDTNVFVGTDVLVVNSATNRVGVNISSPTEALDVSGSAKISGNLIVNTSALAVDSTNNWVGVNKATPAYSLDISGTLNLNGPLQRTVPVSYSGDFTVADDDNWIVVDNAATTTVTLPTASSWPAREIMIKTIQAAVDSGTSDVIPLIGGSAGTAILTNTAGKWAILVSTGSAWQIMAAN